MKINEVIDMEVLVTPINTELINNVTLNRHTVYYLKKRYNNLVNNTSKDFNASSAEQVKIELDAAEAKYARIKKRCQDYLKLFTPFIPQIRNDCKTYLDAYKRTDKCLFSGRRMHGGLYVGRSVENRQVRDSDQGITISFDKILQEMGVKARRGNSIFTSSDSSHAGGYGQTKYVIIPKSTADFSWSESNDDLILSNSSIIPTYVDSPFKKIISDELGKVTDDIDNNDDDDHYWSSNEYHKILYNLDKQNYTNMDFNLRRIKQIFPNSPILKISKKLLKYKPTVDIKKFIDIFKIDTTNFDKALSTRNEILIHGEFYGLHSSVWEALKGKLLK